MEVCKNGTHFREMGASVKFFLQNVRNRRRPGQGPPHHKDRAQAEAVLQEGRSRQKNAVCAPAGARSRRLLALREARHGAAQELKGQKGPQAGQEASGDTQARKVQDRGPVGRHCRVAPHPAALA